MHAELKLKQNLTIQGNLHISGGIYHSVKVLGDGFVKGDLECNNLGCLGTLAVEGGLNAHNARIIGVTTVAGSLKANQIRIQGQMEVREHASCQMSRILGALDVRGNLSGEEIRVKGYLATHGDCAAERFYSSGAFHIGGLLNAGIMHIRLHGASEAKEIGGGQIKVKRPAIHFLHRIFTSVLPHLQAESIEGDDVFLENTRAKVVRGKRVIIGAGCEIDLVEYQTEYTQSKRSVVKESRKMNGE
ncbi:cell shape determination protein CcmA [Brevibacillus sp. SYP-B805]|uniref:cell shape determination protein CcmA n=1 Tax=Brevibacillus sp. SYP-B805 TaxID=1578199 RepID=UPI0013ECC3BA|nr:cell shape determination protein CcmA [Brevibacillus sp. SYP-B805]NGQ95849.1 cell shape determination protein CcmA [Brevibacillus sp. SYP-B805]